MHDELLYPHIRAYVLDTPWAILPSKLAIMLDLLAFRAGGGRLSAEEIQQRIGAAPPRPAAPTGGTIAVLPLYGVISQRASLLSESSGGTSIERFSTAFRQALADPSIKAIVLDVDSPGGAVPGVDEISAEIYRARGPKPIMAVANSLAASAAYWIATAADELAVTPSGEVGSIGVLAVHDDISAAQEKVGVRTTLISAGKYKAEGSPFTALTAEARAYIQERVDEYYGAFTRAISRNRAVPVAEVRGGFGEGRVVGARRAVELGMADRIATLDETISRVSHQRSQPPRGPTNRAQLCVEDERRRLRLRGA